jgi:TonB family protein
MGKIVKHCTACEESFAQKFVFCPNCGGSLAAFEMNPVQPEESKVTAAPTTETAKVSETPNVSQPDNNNFVTPAPPATGIYETPPKIEPAVVPAVTAFPVTGNSTGATTANDVQPRFEQVVSEQTAPKAKVSEISDTKNAQAKDSTVVTKPLAATVTAGANGNGNGYRFQDTNSAYQPTNNSQNTYGDDGFHVTVIEEKNVKQRNVLLLGSMILMLSLMVGGTIYSLFNRDLLVGAIDAGNPIFIPIEDVPMDVEDEQPKPKLEKESGGGGGGGREEETPTSKGRLATQMPDPPLITPTKTIVQKDFELKQPVATTQGNKIIKPTDEAYGDPNSKYTLSSDGMGSGRGQGSGQGTGQGSGRGTGAGSGIGSGFGSGTGDGTGGGSGSGNSGLAGEPPPPPTKPKPVGVTQDIKIIAKPSAKYTDAARQNQFSGTVRVKVTFTSSGQIGSVSVVSNAPYGLADMAIAAARLIKFEPAKKDGVPITKIKQIDYAFTLY